MWVGGARWAHGTENMSLGVWEKRLRCKMNYSTCVKTTTLRTIKTKRLNFFVDVDGKCVQIWLHTHIHTMMLVDCTCSAHGYALYFPNKLKNSVVVVVFSSVHSVFSFFFFLLSLSLLLYAERFAGFIAFACPGITRDRSLLAHTHTHICSHTLTHKLPTRFSLVQRQNSMLWFFSLFLFYSLAVVVVAVLVADFHFV